MRTELGAQRLALDLLRRCTLKKVQMTAVLSDRSGAIFSWGWANDWQHAERHAIDRANPRRVPGATLTIAGRRTRSGNVVCSRPCDKPGRPSCLAFAKGAGITTIEYRTKQGEWIKEAL